MGFLSLVDPTAPMKPTFSLERSSIYLISRDVRDVTAMRASAMALAPCGPRLLVLAWVRDCDG